jgi:hypothetical protein
VDDNYEGSTSGTLTISLYAPTARGTAIIDFGSTPTPSPSAGLYWNNFASDLAGYSLTNLVTTNNVATGYSLTMSTANSINTGWISTSAWNSNNAVPLGLLNSQTAATDGFFVTSSQGKRGVKIAGLSTNRIYNIGVYAGRDASEIRATAYTVRGAATNTGYLTNSGTGIGAGGVNFNNNKVLTFSNVAPDAAGAIYVEYQQSKGSYGYLNSMSIQEKIPVPAGYTAWANAKGLGAGPGADMWSVLPASGSPNYYHYALDLPATRAAVSSYNQKPEIVTQGGTNFFALTIPVRRGAAFTGTPLTSAVRDGVYYRITGSADLATATAADLVEIPVGDTGDLPQLGDYDSNGTPDYEYRRFRFTEPVSSMSRGFIRVHVWPIP